MAACTVTPLGPRPAVGDNALTHREVPHAQRVLQKTLKGHGPAGHPPLTQAPAALHAGEAGIAAQAVVAHAALQVGATQLCGAAESSPARPSRPRPESVVCGVHSQAAPPGTKDVPSVALGSGNRARDRATPGSRQPHGAHTQPKGVTRTTSDKAAPSGAPEGVACEARGRAGPSQLPPGAVWRAGAGLCACKATPSHECTFHTGLLSARNTQA